MRNLLLVICGILVVGALGVVFSCPGPHRKPADFIGEPSPPFRLLATDGTVFRSESFKGKVVLLDFWATWCAPCEQSSKVVQRIHEMFVGRGLKVIGADIMEHSRFLNATELMRFQRQHHTSYQIGTGMDRYALDLGINSIPYFVILDKAGRVRAVIDGFSDGLQQDLEKKIWPLLQEK